MRYDDLHKKYRIEHHKGKAVDKQLIGKLLKYIRPYAGWVILAVILLTIAKCIEALVPVYIGYTTQQIINASDANVEARQALVSQMMYVCFMLIGLIFFGYLLDTISMIIKNWIGQKAIHHLRTEVFNHIQLLPINYYNNTTVGRLMTRTIHDIDQISQMFTESIIPIFGSLILFVFISIGIAIISWKIAIAFLLILPLVGWLTYQFQKRQREAYDFIRNVVAVMNTFVQEHLMGASTIRNFGLQEDAKKQFAEINEDNRLAHVEANHNFSFFISGIDLVQNLALIMAFVFLVSFSPPGTGFQVGAFFTFSLYIILLFRPLADLAERYNILQSAIAAAERVFQILEEPTEPAEHISNPHLEGIDSIVFEDVWFSYEGENWILKGLSFEIRKGESIALVGVTGAGKTTVLNLLLRFYDFQKGSIKINGKDIRTFPLHALRRQFSVVLQDPVIFSGTLLDNISLFDPEITEEKIDAIIDFVNLRMLVSKFPDGMHHQLTERGQNLSVGEMQLLSMARAVVHERSAFILDEATANIDSQTEQMIQETLRRVLSERTALVIAHRLSTIKDVTRIVVLHNGSVAEEGTHLELLQRKGIYEKLYRLQFQQ